MGFYDSSNEEHTFLRYHFIQYQEETDPMEQFTICMMITYLHQTQQHQVSNLYDSSFYFMTSDYRVYKVLDNNDGEVILWT